MRLIWRIKMTTSRLLGNWIPASTSKAKKILLLMWHHSVFYCMTCEMIVQIYTIIDFRNAVHYMKNWKWILPLGIISWNGRRKAWLKPWKVEGRKEYKQRFALSSCCVGEGGDSVTETTVSCHSYKAVETLRNLQSPLSQLELYCLWHIGFTRWLLSFQCFHLFSILCRRSEESIVPRS